MEERKSIYSEERKGILEYNIVRVAVLILGILIMVCCLICFRKIWKSTIRKWRCIRRCFRNDVAVGDVVYSDEEDSHEMDKNQQVKEN